MVDRADADNCSSAMFLARGEFKRGRWPEPEQVVAITLLQSPFIAVSDRWKENAEFIAAAREVVPRLCCQLEEALAQRERLAEALRRILASVVAEDGASARVARETLDEARRLLTSKCIS